jgi:hypothetical protein
MLVITLERRVIANTSASTRSGDPSTALSHERLAARRFREAAPV